MLDCCSRLDMLSLLYLLFCLWISAQTGTFWTISVPRIHIEVLTLSRSWPWLDIIIEYFLLGQISFRLCTNGKVSMVLYSHYFAVANTDILYSTCLGGPKASILCDILYERPNWRLLKLISKVFYEFLTGWDNSTEHFDQHRHVYLSSPSSEEKQTQQFQNTKFG